MHHKWTNTIIFVNCYLIRIHAFRIRMVEWRLWTTTKLLEQKVLHSMDSSMWIWRIHFWRNNFAKQLSRNNCNFSTLFDSSIFFSYLHWVKCWNCHWKMNYTCAKRIIHIREIINCTLYWNSVHPFAYAIDNFPIESSPHCVMRIEFHENNGFIGNEKYQLFVLSGLAEKKIKNSGNAIKSIFSIRQISSMLTTFFPCTNELHNELLKFPDKWLIDNKQTAWIRAHYD